MVTYKHSKQKISSSPKNKQRVSVYGRSRERRAFKEKVKNFFTIPEEDLKEEECKKKFDTYKVFTLTRANIFIGILVFMLLINMLITFDVNFLYLRQILGFLFLIFVPGLLIMLCFKIRDTGFWEYLVYTIGLSVAFIMFAGLAVNWTLPALGITDKPLSLWPILICFNIFLLALWVTAINRNHDFKPKPFLLPKLDTINNIFFIIPIFFPILSILGAFLLNNHGPNILTMIMLGGIAVYVLLLTLFRKRLNHNIYPWALYLMGLALLLMFSMRSWFISGGDIILEQEIFRITQHYQYWDIHNFKDSYNACLSLSILPSVLNIFIKINDILIYKIFIQLIFSISPIIVFVFSKKFLNNIYSFLSAFFFLSFEGFIFSSPMHIRQEIAFIFFGLFVLILFSKVLSPIIKNAFVIIFSLSIILSHYSTSYITAFFIISLTLIYYISKMFSKDRIKHFSIVFVILFLAFAFMWYSQVTETTSGLNNFIIDSVHNVGKMLNEDSPFKKSSQYEVLKEYLNNSYIEYSNKGYIPQSQEVKQKMLSFTFSPEEIATPLINTKFSLFLVKFWLKYKLILQLFSVFSLLIVIWNYKKYNYLFIECAGVFIILLSLLKIIPLFSVSFYYDPMRLHYQSLFFLAPLTIIGFKEILSKFNFKNIFIILGILILFFLFSCGMIFNVFGGNIMKLTLDNEGGEYNLWYVNSNSKLGEIWLQDNYNGKDNIFINRYDFARSSHPYMGLNSKIRIGILAGIFSNKDYVLLDPPAVIEDKGFIFTNGMELDYNIKKEDIYLKEKIYSNGGSEVFK